MRGVVLAVFLAWGVSGEAAADVRFGKNVRIGGHDVSGQTFTPHRRGRFYLYDRQPPKAGCRWVRTAHGRTKTCHWRRR